MYRIRVVWVTGFSNSDVRKRLSIRIPWYERLVRKLLKRPSVSIVSDNCIWNTYAIREFEKFDDVELHLIAPYYYLTKDTSFEHNGVHYHFFPDECDRLLNRLKKSYGKANDYKYSANTKKILDLIQQLQPEVVHYIGAENPYYDRSILDLPKDYPLIVQLQTLMNEPGFSDNYKILPREYAYRSRIERMVIQRADYIGRTSPVFEKTIKRDIRPDAIFLNTNLALTEDICQIECEKKFDFVYFSVNISKAVDLALDAFAIALKTAPNITLDIVGFYTPEYKTLLDNKIQELGINPDSIRFEGKLPTHDDVLTQIRLSRFALLPLKVDLISGTIRESMANGLPVISTITQGTPTLNKDRESILLSPIGDAQAMADNMLRLLNDDLFANTIRANAFTTANERESNFDMMRTWVETYMAVIEYHKNGIPIPKSLL